MHHLIASIMGKKMSDDRHKKAKAEAAEKARSASPGDKDTAAEDPSGQAPGKRAD